MANAKKLPSGNYRVNLYIGKDETGKRLYKSFTDPDKNVAKFMAAQYALTMDEKKKPLSMTVGEAIDKYIDTKTNVLSPSTVAAYRKIRKNNLPGIMNVSLRDLTADAIQAAVNIESATHAPKTVRNQHGLLVAALAQYHPDFVPRTKLPHKVKTEIVIPEQEMITRLIDDVRGTDLEVPVALAACLGLRRSEICALTWRDFNAKKKLLTINKALVQNDDNLWVLKTTKTYSGTRTLDVPEAVVPLLTQKAGDKPGDRIVSATPAQVTDAFSNVRKRLELNMRFHDLRHYYASVLLALGIPDKYAMERMGHATTNMLKTVYQHTLKDQQKDITNRINSQINSLMQHEMQHDT
jgi:Integrase